MTRNLDANLTASARAGQRFQEHRPDTADVYLLARQLQSQALADFTARTVTALVRRGVQIYRRFKLAYARHKTIQELSRVDTRTLRDIGIDPFNIEASVDAFFAKEYGQQRPVVTDRAARRPDGRSAAAQLARFSRKTLRELGYLKDDGEQGSEVQDRPSLMAPANRNTGKDARPHVA